MFYAQSTIAVISVRPINHYGYISTPNQPLRLYQGEEEEEEEEEEVENKRKKKEEENKKEKEEEEKR